MTAWYSLKGRIYSPNPSHTWLKCGLPSQIPSGMIYMMRTGPYPTKTGIFAATVTWQGHQSNLLQKAFFQPFWTWAKPYFALTYFVVDRQNSVFLLLMDYNRFFKVGSCLRVCLSFAPYCGALQEACLWAESRFLLYPSLVCSFTLYNVASVILLCSNALLDVGFSISVRFSI